MEVNKINLDFGLEYDTSLFDKSFIEELEETNRFIEEACQSLEATKEFLKSKGIYTSEGKLKIVYGGSDKGQKINMKA